MSHDTGSEASSVYNLDVIQAQAWDSDGLDLERASGTFLQARAFISISHLIWCRLKFRIHLVLFLLSEFHDDHLMTCDIRWRGDIVKGSGHYQTGGSWLDLGWEK